jgi:serine/threonine protein kinase
LDYQPNKTLSELLAKRHLTEIEIKHYGFELLLAIEYLHKRNIIHRDIKLSNVLLSEKMEVRLCDFGLAIDNGIEYQKNICGTPNYIAPELLNHKNGLKYSFEVDIWAYAVLLYTLFFNKTPFEEKAKGKTKYNIQNIVYTFPKEVPISKEAKDLISSILVKNPNERPKIDEIKASSFFKNGEGIPKYLPVSTLVKAMSQEEEESFVKKAILNDECLDKEVNIAKNLSFSMRAKYYSIENNDNDQNENNSNYSASYSSSSEEGDNKDEIKKNINNLILNNESNNENIINIKNNNNDNKKNNNLNSNQIIYNKEKETLTSFANNDNKSNISRDEEISKIGKFSTNLTSNKNVLSNYYNNSKSFGKLNETGGFLSNNMSNSNSEFFAPTNKIKDKDNSNIIPDDLNNAEEDFKINSKFNINKKISQNLIHQNYSDMNSILNNSHSSRSKSYKSGNIDKNDIISKEINNVIISKFIDLSDKCGVGYILSNGDVGVHFNDGTKMIRIKCTLNFIYLDNQGKITLINTKKKVDNKDYETKINALLLFNKTFIKNSKYRKSFDVDPKLHKKSIDLYVKKWVKSQFAYFFLLSNEKVQVIFDDKTQVIFDFQSKKTIYINKSKQMTMQNINTTNFGNEEMNKRVKYARKILGKL